MENIVNCDVTPRGPCSRAVAALPDAPQVRQYERMGWLSCEVAWRRDLGAEMV